MEDRDIVGVLEMPDEVLEMEFVRTRPVDIDLSKVVASTTNPVSVGTYNSSFGGCCCTIQSNSDACGGSGFLPSGVECTPGGA